MILRALLFVIFFITFCTLSAQEIDITYDYSATEKLLQIFEKKEFVDKDFEELIELKGTKAYLRKLAMFFPNVDADGYKESLKAALNSNYIDDDPYMFNRLVPLLPESKKLLKQVIKNKKELALSTIDKLKAYCPKNLKITATVYLTLGVIGGGWTFDDEPNAFYVDLSSMKGDYLGLAYLSAHELYHLAQYRFMKQIDKSDRINYLLDQMVREGSATYVSDFSKIPSSGPYIDFSKKEYSRNFKRLIINFALFESLVFQAKHDKHVEIDKLYNIGYSGMFQSPMYYVGYHIIKLIEKYKGKDELVSLLKNPPREMFLAYLKVYNENASIDEDFVPLSKSTIDIIKSLR
ncbi:hypothetical protein HME9304_01966 [Flagellimonas maritima]|uniref:DUF2268 domain-containing protein n=1 Tax=Flagellimonas maritima TaxID=1383885 RepID=A0A2Z4LTE5_9FLAO|nr:DUF5700 domain-containing putative Zn-dependent protease [Allomuricauda aurantiaca]AWX44960.1 hypothetical protein HME9304_01966 [Allomuricauda aurantiaca]